MGSASDRMMPRLGALISLTTPRCEVLLTQVAPRVFVDDTFTVKAGSLARIMSVSEDDLASMGDDEVRSTDEEVADGDE